MAIETIGGPQNSSKMQQGAGALACISGGGTLEDKVNAFFKELAQPYKEVPSDAVV